MEEVVKAIFESKIPVISAVGHEVDFTLSDFVADLRASTPTAAGEIVSLEYSALVSTIYRLKNDLDNLIIENLNNKKKSLENLRSKSVLRRPESLIYNEEIRLQNLVKSLNNQMSFKYTVAKKRNPTKFNHWERTSVACRNN